MIFPAEAAPPSPAGRCLHGPSSHSHLCGVKCSEVQLGATTPRALLLLPSSAEPPGMDLTRGPPALLSLLSKFLCPVPAGIGPI